jgi:hypothetical protein
MSHLDDLAPQYFAAGIQGVAAEGPNLMLSFATLVPSGDQNTRAYRTNVRLVMSLDATRQMVQFLEQFLARSQPSQVPAHSMPEQPQ